MAEITNTSIVGAFNVRAGVDADDNSSYGRLRRSEATLEYAPHAHMHAFPASFMALQFGIFTSPNNNTLRSVGVKTPFPVQIFAADVACETCAAATGTVDIWVDTPTAAAASILDAAESVKAGLTVPVRVAPEVGSDEVPYNSEVYIKGTTGVGAMVGPQATLWCQRL